MAKKKSIIDTVELYCSTASADAIDLLLQIVRCHVKPKEKAAPRKRKVEAAKGDGRDGL